ncbi:unnamed protein product [Penicillium nalgiovense]|uniref:BTB domain-containing protein n=1 Tax=Penicillium nalgiovense TaxID=60175 RepID=A0A1V6YZN8_PENNA|nr:hypothetical protein PENNAL_c0006G09494 [Penicillium nalgiovense]CAG7996401.1 unnamed protein product [Penicillium nalgiovense]CAG7999541.1 unnamed protein product [Penicillium nalgiovense]CAG8082625.1 unnamed protein product [Penicillium nalgiovense]CAG8102706.1 unnamed protein product [Penicillium nalgiovense]
MSSNSKISKSIFSKRPVKIIVGSDERIFYVHRGTLEGHPAFDARLKASTDEYEDAIDWSGFDEQTIDCVLNFLYTRGYQAPQTTSVAVEEDEADAGEEAPAQDGEEEQQEEQEVVVDEADEADEEDEQPSPPDSPKSQPSWPQSPAPTLPARARSLSPVAESSIGPDSPTSQALSECDLNDRPLTPLEYCDGVTLATEHVLTQKVPDHEKQVQNQGEPEQETEGNTAAEIYLHAKVYSFASQLEFAKLEQFALNRLAQVLAALEQTDKAPFPYLVDAIRLIYETTSTVDDARNLLSQFVALQYTTLVGEDLDKLITEGGEFVVDLSHKLARKLTTIATAFKRVEYLTDRNEELKAESAEKDKELKALREEVRQGPTQGFPAYTYQI